MTPQSFSWPRPDLTSASGPLTPLVLSSRVRTPLKAPLMWRCQPLPTKRCFISRVAPRRPWCTKASRWVIKDALAFIKFDRGDCKDDDDDFRLKRPLAAAHVDMVKNMCQARPFLEKGMRPWKGSSPQDKWCSAMSAVVFEANLVQAHPPKPKTHPAAQRQCTVCKAGSGPSGDVKFYTVFIPTGSMSPSFSYDPEIQYKAWDVAFSPQLYPRTYEDDEKRRQLQTGRHIELCQEYADYFPEKSCGRDEEPELHVKDMLEALKNFGETRPVPDEIKDARHY